MLNRIIIFLLGVGLIGCSQQHEVTQKTTVPHAPDFATSKIGQIRILPEKPSATTPLAAEVFFRGHEPGRVSYQWLRNGTPIAGAVRPMLSSGHLLKGDFVTLEVRASYPGGGTDRSVSEVVVMGNTPPVVIRVAITPNPATSGDTLQAVADTFDRDRDQLSLTYEWTVDGEPVIGQDGPTLESRYVRRGSKVQVAATPFDGVDEGDTKVSNVLVILNGAPRIVSDPPERAGAGVYRYTVQAEDPDDDPLRFSLEGEVPAGMEVDREAGVIQWEVVPPDKEVTYHYGVVAEDPEGAKSIQMITMSASPPGG